MLRSDGITVLEGLDPQPRCPAWGEHGPWVRWVMIRRNTIAGVSENSKPTGMCGAVVTNWATSFKHPRCVARDFRPNFRRVFAKADCCGQGSVNVDGYRRGAERV